LFSTFSILRFSRANFCACEEVLAGWPWRQDWQFKSVVALPLKADELPGDGLGQFEKFE
jgi:hypothetical protein